jgi:hypothetical protein
MLVTALLYFTEMSAALRLPIAFDSGLPFWSIGEASPANKEVIQKIAADSGVAIDTRRRVDVLASMRNSGVDVVPAIQIHGLLAADMSQTPGRIDTDSFLPLGGISSSYTLLCNQSGEYISYDSDEHGFRNPRGIWKIRPLDVAFVGQSFVQGYCVPEGKSFVDLVRAEYPRTLNLGTSGQAALLQLGAIKEYLPDLTPRNVLWVYQEGMDLIDLRDEMRVRTATDYLQTGFTQRLLRRQREIDAALRSFAAGMEAVESNTMPAAPASLDVDWIGVAKLWNLRNRLTATFAVESAAAVTWLEESNHQPLTDILRQARDITSTWGGRLHFVYLPSWARYRHDAPALDRERTVVLRIAATLGIPSIDVDSAFRTHSEPLSLFPFRRFGHYNESGNAVAGAAILEALRPHIPPR